MPTDTRTVTTQSGTFTGITRENTATYYSLPYAYREHAYADPEPLHRAPGANASRAQAGDAAETSENTAGPDGEAPQAPAAGTPEDHTEPNPLSDTLTVTAPARAEAGQDLPVIAYVHGGRYQSESHDDPWYNGIKFAQDGCVFVSIGYRLRLEGFYTFPGEVPGQYRGVLDVQCALEWIQRNIEAFGGDPTNVTLMGQSAGAGIALWPARRDHYRGAFRRVIASSPHFPSTPIEERRGWLKFLARGKTSREDLRRRDEEREDDKLFWRFASRYPYEAAVGPSPYDPTELAEVPILVTCTHDEMYLNKAVERIDAPLGGWFGRWIATPWFARAYHLDGQTLDHSTDPKRPASRVVSGATVRRFAAATAEQAPGPVWLAEYRGDDNMHAMHCADLPLLFGSLEGMPSFFHNLLGPGASERLAGLFDQVHRTVLAFAHGLTPGWPEYRTAAKEATQETARGSSRRRGGAHGGAPRRSRPKGDGLLPGGRLEHRGVGPAAAGPRHPRAPVAGHRGKAHSLRRRACAAKRGESGVEKPALPRPRESRAVPRGAGTRADAHASNLVYPGSHGRRSVEAEHHRDRHPRATRRGRVRG